MTVRMKEVWKGFDGGVVVETEQEVIAFVGFDDEKELNAAVENCLRSLDKIRCPHCGADRERRGGF